MPSKFSAPTAATPPDWVAAWRHRRPMRAEQSRFLARTQLLDDASEARDDCRRKGPLPIGSGLFTFYDERYDNGSTGLRSIWIAFGHQQTPNAIQMGFGATFGENYWFGGRVRGKLLGL